MISSSSTLFKGKVEVQCAPSSPIFFLRVSEGTLVRISNSTLRDAFSLKAGFFYQVISSPKCFSVNPILADVAWDENLDRE